MPDEALITQIENLVTEIIRLGGENERSQIEPNLTVQDATPTGLSNFIIVSDNKDGDNIVARKVPSVIYSDGDLVNVMFLKGTEPIAFQQGSGSSSGSIWSAVTGTTTDIYYDKGDVGIGKSVAPDATLEILDTTQQQLRLTFQEDTKFADFTVDTSHDLTIDPSSTGQIILASDDVTIGEDLIHSGDTDTKMTFTADKISFDAGGLNMLALTETAQDLVEIGDVGGAGDVDINFSSGQAFLRGSDGYFGVGTTTPQGLIAGESETQAAHDLRTYNNGFGSVFIGQTAGGTKASPTAVTAGRLLMRFSGGGHDGTNFSQAQAAMDIYANQNYTSGAQGTYIRFITTPDGSTAVSERMRIADDGNIGINGITSPSTALDIGAGAIEFNEMSAPGGGAANTARLYSADNGAGKTQLIVVFNTGAAQVLATEP